MNALDTPLEALAFNYLSFAFSTAVAWLAVITAAVSFWKIRAAGCAGPAKSQRPDRRRINEPITAVSTTTTAVNFVLEETDGSATANEGKRRLRRGKFTVYYDEESEGVVRVEGDSTAADGGEGCCSGGNWDRELRMRMGKDVSLGGTVNQDLTVIDGNVVRLWDWEFN
ncbi:uncharacterized protein LOC131320004 [Rhododendron vialii]|uniref:uncharacterized protein LOC131320004 n=1 Tax=Rhododendron vialii TaxID=182163 RepID=UPI00265F147F|nr:uncharacterized protein LOC131320004 [Rhododendron vialii]